MQLRNSALLTDRLYLRRVILDLIGALATGVLALRLRGAGSGGAGAFPGGGRREDVAGGPPPGGAQGAAAGHPEQGAGTPALGPAPDTPEGAHHGPGQLVPRRDRPSYWYVNLYRSSQCGGSESERIPTFLPVLNPI